jgi:diaminohydroxyphosphoribosylaminopyrimidine deaminase/5-amino-6-(5-phosphoribosylamino)uracil reductase
MSKRLSTPSTRWGTAVSNVKARVAPTPAQIDEYWMGEALRLAARGIYTTRPNPSVGCVIVRDHELLGRGYTGKVGEPHAEVHALRDAEAQGHSVVGATAYVTLEPCSHFGRTPPCANALVAAGLGRVVMATLDSNPQVSGQGLAKLAAAGIATTVGVGEADARAINAGFLQTMAGGRPYVRLKVAASLDGRTAMASGESKWITGNEARLDVQHFRARSGAVISGIGTVLADDPLLNVRALADGTDITTVPQPLRVVLDRHGQMPADAQLLNDPSSVLIVGAGGGHGAEVWPYSSLATLLDALKHKKQIHDVLIEAGATLSAAFIAAGLVDELIVYLAPTLLGSDARPMFNLPFSTMSEQLRWQTVSVTQVGDDLRWILRPSKSPA